MKFLPLSAIRLHDGPFLDALRTDLAYELSLDSDRLLAPSSFDVMSQNLAWTEWLARGGEPFLIHLVGIFPHGVMWGYHHIVQCGNIPT